MPLHMYMCVYIFMYLYIHAHTYTCCLNTLEGRTRHVEVPIQAKASLPTVSPRDRAL